ncbi:MAG: hypothetical protein AAF738_04060, partial [Bacteroidota bacterium]
MKLLFRYILWCGLLWIIVSACEESIDVPVAPIRQSDAVWVEGFIEAYADEDTSEADRRPPYVFLREFITPDRSYTLEELENIFVKRATVEIIGSDGQQLELASICLDDFVGDSRQDIIDDFDLDQIVIPAINARADTVNFC